MDGAASGRPAHASRPLDPDAFPPALQGAFLVLQAEVAGLRARTGRQDCPIAELRHARYGKKSEQLNPDARQPAFEHLETAVAEAAAAGNADEVRNACGTTRRHNPATGGQAQSWPSARSHGQRIEEVIEPEHNVCLCGCTDLVKIGEGEPSWRHRFEPDGERRAAGYHPGRFPGHRDDPPQICLPPLRCGHQPGRHTALADRGRAANRGHLGPCGGVRIRRSLAVVSPVPDLRPGWRRPGPLHFGDMASGITACHPAPVVDRMLVHLKRSTCLFMPSRPHALHAPAG